MASDKEMRDRPSGMQTFRRVLRGAAAGATGAVGDQVAEQFGRPGVAGMSLEELKLLLGERERDVDIEAKKSLKALRDRTPGTRGGSGANDPHKRLQFLEKATIGEQGTVLEALDPDYKLVLDEERDQLRKKLGKPGLNRQNDKTNTDAGFKSKEEVAAAVASGKLSKDQGLGILRKQFKMK